MGQSLEVLGKPFGVVSGPVGDELDEDPPLPSAGGRQQRRAPVRDRQLGAPGIVGRDRPGHVTALDGGGDEPAGAGAIDADLRSDVADRDGAALAGGVDRLEDEHVDRVVIDRVVDTASRPEPDESEQRRPSVLRIACDAHVL